MELELAKETKSKFNIKTGYGGIVDIDFIVQSLQLKYGSESKRIRQTNTLEALDLLFKERIIKKNDYNTLASGYRFLRQLENALRLIQDKAASDIYETDFNRAGELIFGETGRSLLKRYKSTTKKIRKVYNSYFS